MEPATHRIEVVDRMLVPAALAPSEPAGLLVALHPALELTPGDAAWKVEREGEPASRHAPRTWRVRPAEGGWPDGDVTVPLRYEGEIHRPPEQQGAEYARSFATTPGTIGEEGAVLTRATWWVPHIGEDTLTFCLTVDLPSDWDVVSQGSRTRHEIAAGRRRVTWDCPHPMEEVYLIANQWKEYSRSAGSAEALAFLRQPDDALAAKYLEATAQYLEMYHKLIGPYPFGKFALVENFWETGYGMPSFTLLGPKVIRFPFILHSSYPHEILHNWWGNSVYVDWKTGNWCEGLTAYLADHLIKEGRGQGEQYRRDTLKKFRSYVSDGRDFPLVEFTSRRSGATEAVGYGKALMVFHMLRIEFGDDAFRRAIQTFYRRHRWQQASWSDIEKVFAEVTGKELGAFFAQWTKRKGAPALSLSVERTGEKTIAVVVRQTQEEAPYHLRVPLVVTTEDPAEEASFVLELRDREHRFTYELGSAPLRVDLDPRFDVFRRLDVAETPPTLGELFGAERVTIVLPSKSQDPLAEGWADLARTWSRHGDVQVVSEETLESLPKDRAVWVFGEQNRWAAPFRERLPGHGVTNRDGRYDFAATHIPRANHSAVYVVRHPSEPTLAMGWIQSGVRTAMGGLARKLPHYGKYSWLGFEGDEPTNVAKGEWSAVGSPLVAVLTEGTAPERRRGSKRAPLGRLAPVFDPASMMRHVHVLAAAGMEGRGVGTQGLDKAGRYIADALRRAGLEPGADDGTFFQTFEEDGGPDGQPAKLRNVVGVIPGTDPQLAKRPLIIGAHYDHLGFGWPDVHEGQRGQLHPGADDNASGVAVLLEVAKLMATGAKSLRPIVFVAFSGEEWGRRGSKHFVRATQRFPAKNAIAMVNLDTIGRLGTQKLMVLGSGSATEWVHIARGVGFTTGVESTCVPEDPEASDQASFLEVGIPAIQLFSGAHPDYHRPTDTIDKVDADGMAKVATWLRETATYLADRKEPLTPGKASAKKPERPSGPRTGRRVSLGTVPSFSHRGPGVKVDDVLAGSPADKAGIRAGDLVIAVDGEEVKDLRAYSQILKKHAPGDVIRVRVKRGEEEVEVEATLVAR
jgi:hypothetical protein